MRMSTGGGKEDGSGAGVRRLRHLPQILRAQVDEDDDGDSADEFDADEEDRVRGF